MEKINKKMLLVIVAVVALVVLIFIFSSIQKNEQKISEENNKKVVLVLDYEKDRKQSFQIATDEKNRAWNLLQQVAALSSIQLEADNNFRPQRIDGLKNGYDNKKWNFYVNGVKQESSPFDTFVESPAEVAFRFE